MSRCLSLRDVVGVAAFLVLAAVAGCPANDDLRLQTRGTIAGRVALVDVDGLNDLSRVRVDLGNGEGSAIVGDDGVFVVPDLEADAYDLTVTYTGGLTADASRSAYERFTRRVPLLAGSVVDVGTLQLELAKGRVTGTVQARELDGSVVPAGGVARLRLSPGGEVRTAPVDASGAYAFEAVPVGFHTIEVDRDDFAVPDGGAFDAEAAPANPGAADTRACGAAATVREDDDDVAPPALRQVRARPTLVPGPADLYSTDGGTWWVKPDITTLSPDVQRGFAAVARVWLDDEAAAPDFVSVDDDLALPLPSPGRRRLLVQVGDGCRYRSGVVSLPVVVDRVPPAVRELDVAGANGLPGDALVVAPVGSVLPVLVDATDDIAGVAAVGAGLLDDQFDDGPENDASVTAAACDGLAYTRYEPAVTLRPVVDVALPDGDGRYTIVACVRDAVGLLSPPVTRRVVVDTTPPVVRGIVVGDGSGFTLRPDVAVRFDVDGATEMRAGLTPGLRGVAWQPFLPDARLTLPPIDGTTTIYTRFRDAAGNETDEVGIPVTLDTRGTVTGRVFVEGRDDLSAARVRLLGASVDVAVDASGAFTLPAVPAGIYTLEALVGPADIDADGFLVAQTGIAVEPRQTTTAPDLFIARKRGNVGGTLALEALVAGAGDAGALLELVEAGLTTTTGQDGAFGFSGVLTGTYTLRASKPGYVTQTVYPVVVEHQRTTAVPFADALRLLRGSLTLRALREDGGAAAAVQAVLTGALSVDAFAGDDGVVRFDDLLPGAYALTLRGTGDVAARYRPQARAPRVVAGETTDLGDVVLPLARGTLTGVAIAEGEAGTGPTAGVLVEAGGSTTQSDASGRFTLAGLIAGLVDVRVSLPDHAAVTLTGVTIVDGQTTTVEPSPLLRLRGGVRGRVFLEGGADPTLVAASLQGQTGSARADVDGAFVVDSVLPGTQVLVLETTGEAAGAYERLMQPVTIVAGQRVELPAVTLPRARGRIALAVRLEDESDFGGVVVDVVGAGVTAVSDALGNVSLEAVPVGTHTLRLSKTSYTPVERTGVVVTTRATTTLAPVTLALNRGVISGRALFDDASEFSGITVSLLGADGTATTDAAGEFVLTGVKPGTWNVLAQATGYEPARVNGLFVGPGQALDVGVLTLNRKRGVVSGRVVLEGAADPAGVVVTVDNTGYRGFPDAQGNYALTIPVGNYDGIAARKEFFADARYTETVTVTDVGAFTVPTLSLRQQSGLLSGTIALADSRPGDVQGSTVTLEGSPGNADGVVVRATVGADGFYSFDQPEDFELVSPGAHPLVGATFGFRGIPVGAYRLTAIEPPPPSGQSRTRDVARADIAIDALTPAVFDATLPKVFVTIARGAAVSLSRTVQVDYGATNCLGVRFAVDVTAANPFPPASVRPFGDCTGSTTITFDTDGEHSVSAEFDNGVLDDLPVVSDSIFVDSAAVLTAFTHNVPAGVKKTLGDTVTFSATAEAGGRAVAAITGYDSAIPLLESSSTPGSYSAAYVLRNRIDTQPTSPTASTGSGTVVLTFTDRFGNIATKNANTTTSGTTTTTAHTPLTIGIPPVITNLRVIPDLVAQNATVTFTTDETASTVVRVGKTESSLCVSNCATTAAGTTHSVLITGTQAGESGGVFLRNTQYFVRIDATDAKGNVANSATIPFFLAPNPPSMVVPIPMDKRVLIRWEAPPQEDLAGYFVERSDNGGPFARISGATPYNHEVLTFDDRTVVNGRQYTYRVRAVDLFGNASDPATTTDMAKNADGTFDATKLAAFSACGTVTPAVATSTAGTDIAGGVLPLCTVWTNAGSPFRVNGSIAVIPGGIFIVGPSIEIRVAQDAQVVVQGRIGVYGDRGGIFDVVNTGFEDFDPLISNGIPNEVSAGQVRIGSGTGTWRGIFVRNSGSKGPGRIGVRGYAAGDIVSRTSLSNLGASAFDSDSRITAIRASIGIIVGVPSVHTGAPAMFLGGSIERTVSPEGTGTPPSFVLGDELVDVSVINLRQNGVAHYFSSGATVRGSAISINSGCEQSMVITSDDSILGVRGAEGGGFGGMSYVIKGIGGSILSSGTRVCTAATIIGHDVSFSSTSDSTSVVLTSSVLKSTTERIGVQDSIRNSEIFGKWSITEPIGSRLRGSLLTGVACELRSSISSLYSVVSADFLAGFAVECQNRSGDNFDAVVDFRDDPVRGIVDLDLSFVGAFPHVLVDGPQIVNRPALRRGVTLRIDADDHEDGSIAAAASYWTDSSGVRVGNGPFLTLPTTLPATTTSFMAHTVDSDGLESDMPWPVEVRNDSTLADNWMWPDRDRWRVAALRMDQLPPKANATTVGTFRWRCFTPGCTTTCAIDPDPNADVTTVATAPCRSPVEVAGLAPGSHTFVVQPRDPAGKVIDLPQRYTWTVAAPTNDLTGVTAAPVVRVTPGADGSTDVAMVSGDTPNQVVTCSVDGRHELPCRAGLSISGIGANGQAASDLTIRVRNRDTGREIQSSRGIHLNDPDDVDGDGWLDRDASSNVVDPCLAGAERGATCDDADGDTVPDDVDVCPAGQPTGNLLRQVVAGNRHTCALRGNGTVFCSGNNNLGQLGDTTTTARNVPVIVSGIGSSASTRAVAIDAGLDFTCAVLVNGTVNCWGSNAQGQLGNNSATNATTPVEVSGLTSVVGLSAGGEHACAVLSDNTVRCWGRNDRGQLGDGTTTSPRRTPVSVSSLTGVSNVTAGRLHTCAALFDGSARCWGESDDGRLGEGTIGADRTSPATVADLIDVVRVAAGRGQSCAIRTNGALSCWGDNREAGALGNNSTTSSATPVQIFANGVRDLDIALEDSSTTSSTATVCALLDTGGFRCWGRNSGGQFGNGSTTGSTTPLAISQVTGAASVATANASTCVLKADGSVSCWGRGAEGQLGNGTNTALLTAPAISPSGWSPVPFRLGPLFNDVDGDGCEDTP